MEAHSCSLEQEIQDISNQLAVILQNQEIAKQKEIQEQRYHESYEKLINLNKRASTVLNEESEDSNRKMLTNESNIDLKGRTSRAKLLTPALSLPINKLTRNGFATFESHENIHQRSQEINIKYEKDSDCNVDLEEADELNSDHGSK